MSTNVDALVINGFQGLVNSLTVGSLRVLSSEYIANITQAQITNAGGTLTLSKSGTYILTEDVKGTIVFGADNMGIDLGNHKIDANGAANCIRATGINQVNCFNGSLTGASDAAVFWTNVRGTRMWNCRFYGNANDGVRCVNCVQCGCTGCEFDGQFGGEKACYEIDAVDCLYSNCRITNFTYTKLHEYLPGRVVAGGTTTVLIYGGVAVCVGGKNHSFTECKINNNKRNLAQSMSTFASTLGIVGPIVTIGAPSICTRIDIDNCEEEDCEVNNNERIDNQPNSPFSVELCTNSNNLRCTNVRCNDNLDLGTALNRGSFYVCYRERNKGCYSEKCSMNGNRVENEIQSNVAILYDNLCDGVICIDLECINNYVKKLKGTDGLLPQIDTVVYNPTSFDICSTNNGNAYFLNNVRIMFNRLDNAEQVGNGLVMINGLKCNNVFSNRLENILVRGIVIGNSTFLGNLQFLTPVLKGTYCCGVRLDWGALGTSVKKIYIDNIGILVKQEPFEVIGGQCEFAAGVLAGCINTEIDDAYIGIIAANCMTVGIGTAAEGTLIKNSFINTIIGRCDPSPTLGIAGFCCGIFMSDFNAKVVNSVISAIGISFAIGAPPITTPNVTYYGIYRVSKINIAFTKLVDLLMVPYNTWQLSNIKNYKDTSAFFFAEMVLDNILITPAGDANNDVSFNNMWGYTALLDPNTFTGYAVSPHFLWGNRVVGVMVENINSGRFTNVSITNIKGYSATPTDYTKGIWFKNCKNFSLKNVDCTYNFSTGVATSTGVDLENCQNITLTDCDLLENQHKDIIANPIDVTQVIDPTLNVRTLPGGFLPANLVPPIFTLPDWKNYTKGLIDGGAGYGAIINGCNGVVLTNVKVLDSNNDSILLLGINNNIIIEKCLCSKSNNGINVDAGATLTNVIIRKNNIIGNVTDGINANAVAGALYIKNTAYGNGTNYTIPAAHSIAKYSDGTLTAGANAAVANIDGDL